MGLKNSSIIFPDFFETDEDLFDFSVEFSQSRYRFCFGDKEGWLKAAHEFVDEYFQGPAKRKAIKELLEDIKGNCGFIRLPLKGEENLHFNENDVLALAQQLSDICEFVVKSSFSETQELLGWQEIRNNLRTKPQNPRRYRGGLNDTIAHMKPLFLNSKSCWLIDQYFDALRINQEKTRDLESFLLALNEIARHAGGKQKITLVSRLKKALEMGNIRSRSTSQKYEDLLSNAELEWQRFLRENHVNQFDLRLVLLTEQFVGSSKVRVHDRHMWTNNTFADFTAGFLTVRAEENSYAFVVHSKEYHKEFQNKVIDHIDNSIRNESFCPKKTVYTMMW